MDGHCPQTGKIYMIIVFSLIFTSLLTSINVLGNKEKEDIYGTGIAINIIQTVYTLYLVYKDLFGTCSKIVINSSSCGQGCKWYDIAPPNFKKCTNTDIIKGYMYIPIMLLSSSYLLSFGIIGITDDSISYENDIVMLYILSVLVGSIGILYVCTDVVCNIGCYC